MSSSSRNASRLALLALAGTAAPVTWGEQWFFIPRVEASAEWNTNRELVSNKALEDATEGYRLTLESTLGVLSPRGNLELRPRVVLQEYPDRAGVDPVELGLDLRAGYDSLKSQFTVRGRFRRRDTLNAEYGEASFDEFDPTTARTGEGGIVLVGTTRTDVSLNPQFTYRFSDINSITGGVGYEKREYDIPPTVNRVGFDSQDVELWLNHVVNERLQFSAGPYLSFYEADDGSNDTDSTGAQANFRFASSQVSTLDLRVRVERSDVTQFFPVRAESSETVWGLEFSGVRRLTVGDFRFSVGRFLQPSAIGGRGEADEIRLQYNRPFSARLQLLTAARYSRDQRVDGLGLGDDVKRTRFDSTLRWLWTPSWYLSGGYRYALQDAASERGSADDHSLFLSVGYNGLDARARRIR